jgi:hypothetical protein
MRQKNIILNIGGGLGDSIFLYFMTKQFRYIDNIKQQFPEYSICCVNTCHMSWAYELVYMHPNIDSHLIYKWYPPGHERERNWTGIVPGTPIEQFAQNNQIKIGPVPPVYMSATEIELTSRITDGKPYITVQAFAGLPFRGCRIDPYTNRYMCYPDFKYIETMKILNEKYGYRIVLVGKSNTADYGVRAQNAEFPEFPKHPDFIDMTDKGSIRTSVHLVRESAGYFGVFSSMVTAAASNDVPLVVFHPIVPEIPNLNPISQFGGAAAKFSFSQKWADVIEMTGDQFLYELDPEFVADKLIENIKIKDQSCL